MLKRFTQEIYEEGQKQEYLDRKQERGEDTREYYTDKRKLQIQEYAPDKRRMVEFKDEMLMGLYNAKLKKTCLFFMPEELQHENKIKTVLDSQLKTTHTDSIETVENSKRVDKMCEIGNSNREPVSCDNLGKEEQVSHGCKNERQDTG